MVSLVIGFIVAVIIGIAIGITDRSIVSSISAIIMSGISSIFICIFIGICVPMNPISHDDYEVLYSGNSLYYLRDNNIEKLDEPYKIEVNSDIQTIVYRVNKYDRTYFLKPSASQILIPESQVSKK